MAGRVKAHLRVGDKTILEHQRAVLQALFERVIVVGAHTAPFENCGLPVIVDRVADAGPLAGVDAALASLQPNESGVFCVASDMPLITPAAVRLVCGAFPSAPAVYAQVGGRKQPLFAVYRRASAAQIHAAVRSGRRKAMQVLSEIGAKSVAEADFARVDPCFDNLLNVNTAADLDVAQARWRARTVCGES